MSSEDQKADPLNTAFNPTASPETPSDQTGTPAEDSSRGTSSPAADTAAESAVGESEAPRLDPPAEPPVSLEPKGPPAPVGTLTPAGGILPWLILAVITGIGAYYRFLQLDLKPLHHDEGVNGWFIYKILDEGVYKYNPRNYHGPLLYFFNTIAVAIGGRTVEALRFMPALFGTLAIPAMALFRRHLGWFGVLVAALYVAIAPLEIYFSRTAIHEIYNFVFNMTLVGGVAAWLATRERRYLILGGVSLSALFATKETTVITIAAMVPAVILAVLFGKGPLPGPDSSELTGSLKERCLALLPRGRALFAAEKPAFSAAWIGFLVVWVLLFSSLFTNLQGLGSFFAAFFAWGDTGTDGKGHEKVWSYFLTHLLWPYYRPLIFWGMLGLFWSGLRRERLAIFTLVWMVLVTTAYSIIPYKTPWCVLSFSGPLFIGMGYLMKNSWRALSTGSVPARAAGAFFILLSLGLAVPYAVPMSEDFRASLMPPKKKVSLTNPVDVELELARLFVPFSDAWTINFLEYDVKGHPFIYVQNVREYLDLTNDLNGLIETAQFDGDEKQPRILMIDAKNPMRWYLNKTGTQSWRGKLDEEAKKMMPKDVDIVLVAVKESPDVKALLGDDFVSRRYHERPGRKIDIYVRKTLWEQYEIAGKEGRALAPSKPFKAKSYSDSRSAEMTYSWSKRAMN